MVTFLLCRDPKHSSLSRRLNAAGIIEFIALKQRRKQIYALSFSQIKKDCLSIVCRLTF